jgi:RNA polymerase sigma-70 factor (ECF subfamily)
MSEAMDTAGARGSDGEVLDRLIRALRPKLHRYCARMTGSAIDGEDALQQALEKAVEAFPRSGPIAHPERWLLRIAHNSAVDLVRRRGRLDAGREGDDPDMLADPASPIEARAAAAAALRTFMALPAAQRSSVILMDVLGYSLDEIGEILGASIPAVKASLHRGRARLRAFAAEPENRPLPALAAPQRERLATYVDRFNARDFDAVRDMLAADVRLDLVSRLRHHGKAKVGVYFTNYAKAADWRFASGLVDGYLAAIASDPDDPTRTPTYFVLLEWSDEGVVAIRDFYHARYAVEGAEIALLG